MEIAFHACLLASDPARRVPEAMGIVSEDVSGRDSRHSLENEKRFSCQLGKGFSFQLGRLSLR